ncbi:hypothetical protein TSUD_62630 [Trifolium subterraneum]|uniref:Amino acid transporter transmembrane domain-containing protein n=1 Tax=Trifolium subterraneum TaxID=3900 RepID=A0A2Z6MLL9_TRISU|nr:hypothetical protein TSUD_62630 [Trifolium subterraneum]
MLPRSRTLPSRIHQGVIEERYDIRHYLEVEEQPKIRTETESITIEPNYSKCFDDDGTFWTATAHIITAVIGSGVLSLAWAIAQLGWAVGPVVMILFAGVNLYTSSLLTQCYRTDDSVTGQRNYTYTNAVKSILGGKKVKICGMIQYVNLFGIAIGYTIAASVSMMAIKRSNCYHESHGKDPCHMSSNWYMITFGIAEVILSQIPDFDQVWWLSIVAAIMSFTYSAVGLGLGVAKVAENRTFQGSLMGISIGTVTQAGTVTGTQKIWRSLQALGAMAFAYSFSIILIEIQVFSQPLFAFVEKWSALGILGAFGFWPLTVYFPIDMYISQKKIGKWTNRWLALQILSGCCLIISILAAVGSIAGVVLDLKTYKPFKTSY